MPACLLAVIEQVRWTLGPRIQQAKYRIYNRRGIVLRVSPLLGTFRLRVDIRSVWVPFLGNDRCFKIAKATE